MGAEQSSEAAAPAEETTVAAAAEPAQQAPAGPNLAEIEEWDAQKVVSMLNESTAKDTIAACCKRVRVLCRDLPQCEECDKAGAAKAVIKAMKAFPSDQAVQLQSLAAIVNLCSVSASATAQ